MLAENDCVILPGIGGFIAHYQPAGYDEETGCISAPLRTVGFNRALTMNDGLIIQAYMQNRNLNYPDASKLVYKDVARVRQELNDSGRAVFAGLGELSKSGGGTYCFAPAIREIATPMLFALPSVRAVPLREADSEEAARPEEEGGEIARDEIPGDGNGKKYVFSFSRRAVHNIVAVTAAVVLSLAISTPVGETGSAPAKATAMFGVLDMGRPATQAVATETPAAPAATVEEPAETAGATAKAQPERQTCYTIVLASDVSERNAGIFVAELKRKGLEKAEVYETPTMRRVIYSRYASESLALQELSRIGGRKFASDAWILKLGD